MCACLGNVRRHPGGLKSGRRGAVGACIAPFGVVHVFVCMILSTFWHENDLESQPGATPRMCACLGNVRRHPGGLKSGRRGAVGARIAPFRVKLLFVCVMLSIFLHDDNLDASLEATSWTLATLPNVLRNPCGLNVVAAWFRDHISLCVGFQMLWFVSF